MTADDSDEPRRTPRLRPTATDGDDALRPASPNARSFSAKSDASLRPASPRFRPTDNRDDDRKRRG